MILSFAVCASVRPKLIIAPPPPAEVPVAARGTTDETTYPGFTLYTTKYFKFYTLIKKSANFDPNALDKIKDALDYWSVVLRDTVLPGQVQSKQLYDGTAYFNNPLTFLNDGFVICINQITGAANLNGAGSKTYIRSNPGSIHHQLPSAGFFYINSVRKDILLNNITPSGRTELFYIAVHEIGHALGLGTSWHVRAGSTISRSFIVGAGDMSNNTIYGTRGNIFYTIDRGNGSRSTYDTGPILNGSTDASYTYAYNPSTPVGNHSLAVSAYNECFGTTLTAIPVENGMGAGSYGAHWAEGDAIGYDSRQYYSNSTPGAPTLQDELMTPSGEGLFDTPISKITLGALADLGWSVDMSFADNYEPLVHVIRYDASNTYLEVKKNNFGGYKRAWSGGSQYVLFSHMRKGLTYTFFNETGEDLSINQYPSFSKITAGVATGVIDGKQYLRWSVPTTFPNTYVLITGSKPNAINLWAVTG